MPPDSDRFTALNLPPDSIPEWMGSFSLSAPANTDLWRKPPSRDTSTAPLLYTSLREPFVAAEVTVSGDFELEWDQAGLVIFAGSPPGCTPSAPDETTHQLSPPGIPSIATSPTQQLPIHAQPPPYTTPSPPLCRKWLKAALELTSSTLQASTVSCTADGADWSASPLSPLDHLHGPEIRLKIERIGYALWVWFESEESDGRRIWRKLREVTWFFWGVEEKEIHVGVFVSRPAELVSEAGGEWGWNRRRGEGAGKLFVRFEGLEIY